MLNYVSMSESEETMRAGVQAAREQYASSQLTILTIFYQIAQDVKQVFSAKCRGSLRPVMAKLARELGLRRAEVAALVAVAEVFAEDAFTTLAQRQDKDGKHLTPPHFVLLAKVDDKNRRAELIERTFAGGLTVNALKKLIRADEDAANPAQAAQKKATKIAKKIAGRFADSTKLRGWLGEAVNAVDLNDQAVVAIVLASLVAAEKALPSTIADHQAFKQELAAARRKLSMG